MPTYDYRCNACEHQFEEFQSITAKPLRTCPECGKKQLERLIGTGAGIIFKGSGFYETDYRSDSYKKAAEKDNGKADKSGSDSTSDNGSTKKDKAEKKSDAKATSTPKKSCGPGCGCHGS